MPWLEASGDAARSWQVVIKNAFLRRLNAEQLSVPLRALQQRHRTNPQAIADILLSFRAAKGSADDPLLISYIEVLLRERYFAPDDLLRALLRSSRYARTAPIEELTPLKTALPSCEERVFTLLAQLFLNPSVIIPSERVHGLVFAITSWLRAISGFELTRQLENGGMHTPDVSTGGMYEALGVLAVAIFVKPELRELAQRSWWKERRAMVVAEMETFDTNVLNWLQSQATGRLRALADIPPFNQIDDQGRPVFGERQILASIPEIPAVASRAGLFIWLNGALIAQPLADDMLILSYLQARFPGDAQSALVYLLVAAFDVLTNAMLRQEPRPNVKIIRSFICNKVPLLLTMLSGAVAPPMTVETCIQMALMPDGMIAMEPLLPVAPTARSFLDLEVLKGTRLDFLQACALHGLIAENGIATILQESIALPRVIKYQKDSLVAQCANNVGRLDSLVDDLDGMQGNAAAITGCIVDTVTNLCDTKDTMSLKSVCHMLVKRLSSLDIAMQHTTPSSILVPLCAVLNEWVHDPDQGEFTPGYEEFASILLLVLAMRYRYDLPRSDLGVASDSFVGQLIKGMFESELPTDLPEEQASRLSKWIEGLFAVDEDGGTGGISDEVMRSCSPQSFYLLVPALLDQSIIACHCKALPISTLKSGLELLLEPFLLPSLIMGLGWLAQHAWQEQGDVDVLLQVVDKLLSPSSGSQETRVMHAAVLPMVAGPLRKWLLKSTTFRVPHRALAASLAEKLKPYVAASHRRTPQCSKAELDEWMATEGGLVGRVRQQVRELAQWAGNNSNPLNPPPRYTSKEILAACQLRGSRDVLAGLLAEIESGSAYAHVSSILDVCAAIVCAHIPASFFTSSSPSAPSQNPPLDPAHALAFTISLRESLRLRATNLSTLQDLPRTEAEATIHLFRRVEAQLSAPSTSTSAAAAAVDPSLPNSAAVAAIASIQDHHAATDQIMQDLGLDLVSTSAAVSAPSATSSAPNNPLHSNHTAAAAAMNMDLSQAQIFADLDLPDMNPVGVNIDHTNLTTAANVAGTAAVDSAVLGDLNQEENIWAGLEMDMGLDMALGDLGDDDLGFG